MTSFFTTPNALRRAGALALLLTGWSGAVQAAAGITNPAAALCVKDGAKIETAKAADGSDSAICVFPSGERIKAWAYFRNKHRTTAH